MSHKRTGKSLYLAVIGLLYSQTAHAAEAAGNSSFLPMLLQSVAALAAVLGLFAVVVWGMRRLPGASTAKSGSSTLRIVQRLPLAGKHSLAIVAYGREQWLIALSPNAITPVSRVNINDEIPKDTAGELE